MKRIMTDQEIRELETKMIKEKFIETEKRKLILRVKSACIKDKAAMIKIQLMFYEKWKYAILPSDYLTQIQVVYCFKEGIKDYEIEYENNVKKRLLTD